MNDPQTLPAAAAAGPSWIPGTLSEWVIMSVVVGFLYMVKQQNDRILPALAEVTNAIRSLPAALKDAIRDGIREHDHSQS